MCVCVYVSLSECFIFTPPRIFWRARLSFESFEVEAKQNKTRQKIFANTHSHTYTTNVFQKYCLIWKVLRRSSVHEFHICVFATHKHTISRSINLRARVLSVSMAFTPHSICLSPSLSPSLSQSQSVALSQFVFSKKGVGALHYKNFTYALWIFFFFLVFLFILTMLVALLLLINCQMVFCILFTLKNHRNVAHTQHSHKVAEILNTTHSFMQLLYCIKSPKTRQKNTHNNNKGRRRQTAQQQRWRSVALFLFSLNERQCVQKYEQRWHSLFTLTHTHTLSPTLLQGVCLPAHVCHWYLWCAFVMCMCVCDCVCLCYHHCLCTLCEKRALK